MADSGLLEQAKNLAQRRQIARARPLAVLLTGLLAVAVALDCASALAWSARKPAATQPVRRPARPRPAASKPPTQAAGAEPTLAAQVQALLQQSQPSPAALLAALRLASQAREAALVAGLAERLAASPKASALQLAQAAALAGGEALVLQLWTKAWKLSARQPVVARQIAQGYVDALLAAGQVAEARAVLVSVLNQTPAGQRRPLYERSAALARLSGEMEETAAQLGASRDPDAQLVAAQLLVETGDEEAGLKVLERAWQSYPGHRALQAALSQALLRLGRREQLRKVVDQVVRLAPGDPLPYLAVLDAHIAARDQHAARALSDELARRWPRHDVLLEALIDREQRLGDDGERSRRLYVQLLEAAPRDPQYAEAFAEWLLGRGEEKAALVVLERLKLAPGGPVQALLRQAAMLLAHGKTAPLLAVLERLQQQAPADPRVVRLQAQAAGAAGKHQVAERIWLRLTELPIKPGHADRLRAADARQALMALYRQQDWLTARLTELATRLRANPADLGVALLWLDADAQGDARQAMASPAWIALAQQLRQSLGPDPELLLALASGLQRRGAQADAMAALFELRAIDPDAAEGPLQQLLDGALARGDGALAARIEAELARGQAAGAPSSSALLKLGELHLRYGDPAGAAALFRQAAAANPSDARPVARLAALFRQTGETAQEEAALRDIVQRTSDPDELESAGQRLVTVALSRGRSGELVRWLDAVLPQHPRRDALMRFRAAAYDVYLRSAALERELGGGGPAPAPGAVADALGNGDLAQQVRALRQLYAARRMIPPSVAVGLLASDNPSLRRDTALVLGASGQAEAAQLLRDAMAAGVDRDEDVLMAQLSALAQLPAVSGLDAVLRPLANRTEGPMALLVMGRSGSPELARELVQLAGSARRDHAVAAIAALGVLVGRHHHDPTLEEARAVILDAAARASAQSIDLPRAVAALFAVRAARLAVAPRLLAEAAVQSRSLALQRAAVALLASTEDPQIELPLVDLGNFEGLRSLRGQVVRETLVPWLALSAPALAEALARAAPELEQAWTAALIQPDAAARRAAWCASWKEVVPAGSAAWQRLCAAAQR